MTTDHRPSADAGRGPERVVVTGPSRQQFTLVAGPSGVIDWQYGTEGPDLAGLAVAVAAFGWNVLGRLAFRFGWSVEVYDERDRRVARHRYRSKRAAIDALPSLASRWSEGGPTCDHGADPAVGGGSAGETT